MKATTATSMLILLSHLAAYPAIASGIKDMVSDETLAAYCATVPLGSETTATLPGLDGTEVTGTIHCEAEDLIVGSDDALDDTPGTDDGTLDQGPGDVADDTGDDVADDSGTDDSGDDDDSDGDDDSDDDDSGDDD